MPVHDWKRVTPAIFHDFHLSWIAAIKSRLNQGLLPAGFYARIEPRSQGPDTGSRNGHSHDRTAPELRGPWLQRISIRRTSDDEIGARIEIVSPVDKSDRDTLRAFVDVAVAAIRRECHLLVADLFPPGPFDPRGIHGAIWGEIGGKPYTVPEDEPLVQVTYVAISDYLAYVESCAVGEALAPLPLFLDEVQHVLVPMEETYATAYHGVPKLWRAVLEG